MKYRQQLHRKAVLLVIGLVFGNAALAGGESGVTVNAPLAQPVTNPLPVNQVGTTAYNTQEGVHSAITATTGVIVPHSYVVIKVNGQSVPVDPFRFNR